MMTIDQRKRFLQNVHGLIHSQLSEEQFTVEQLAGQMYMHRSSFCRKYKSISGQCPSKTIQIMRMHKAKELLLLTSLPVAQITQAVGFKEISNFSRAFKRFYRKSPTRLRSEWIDGMIGSPI